MNAKTVLLLIAFFLLGFWIAQPSPPTGLVVLSDPAMQAFFCPQDACDQQLINRIHQAQQSIDIAVYSFTLDSLSNALVQAHQRGVLVRVLVDAGQANSQYAEDEKLEAAGIPLKRMDLERGSMHNKYIIIDQQLVGTGSYNYSKNASTYNKENLIFIVQPTITNAFSNNFEALWN